MSSLVQEEFHSSCILTAREFSQKSQLRPWRPRAALFKIWAKLKWRLKTDFSAKLFEGHGKCFSILSCLLFFFCPPPLPPLQIHSWLLLGGRCSLMTCVCSPEPCFRMGKTLSVYSIIQSFQVMTYIQGKTKNFEIDSSTKQRSDFSVWYAHGTCSDVKGRYMLHQRTESQKKAFSLCLPVQTKWTHLRLMPFQSDQYFTATHRGKHIISNSKFEEQLENHSILVSEETTLGCNLCLIFLLHSFSWSHKPHVRRLWRVHVWTRWPLHPGLYTPLHRRTEAPRRQSSLSEET